MVEYMRPSIILKLKERVDSLVHAQADLAVAHRTCSRSLPMMQKKLMSSKNGIRVSVESYFIPEEDHWWLKIDYSQIEYRFMAHFACNAGPLDTSAEDVKENV